jgi:hypothetical protein
MSNEEAKSDSTEKGACPRYQVRLPGFITDEASGLGDVIKRATYAMGGSVSKVEMTTPMALICKV